MKRCWGCSSLLHRECAGGPKWGPGPTHCADCWEFFRRAGVREVVFDTHLMHRVVTGVHHEGADEAARRRCEAASLHFRWDGERLWLKG